MKSSITKIIVSTTLTVVLGISPVMAVSNGAHEARLWRSHEQARNAVITSWRDGDHGQLQKAVFRVLTVETRLVGRDYVQPHDSRLLQKLAADNETVSSEYQLPAFAYRVLLHELQRKVGYAPIAERIFIGKSFRVEPNDAH